MKKILFLFLICLLFASCSTLLNKAYYPIEISSNVENAIISLNDSTYHLPSEVFIERTKNDLDISLVSDTILRHYKIKSSVSPGFLYGNLFWVYAAPIGYMVDLSNSKRFYYGRSLFLNGNDSTSVIYTPLAQKFRDYFAEGYPANQGQLNLVLSFPWVNQFTLTPMNESRQTSIGFWGISAGLEYYYRHDKFVSLRASANTDFFFPFPVPYDMIGMEKRSYAKTVSISHHNRIDRFAVGYGLSYSYHTWDTRPSGYGGPIEGEESVNVSSQSLGLLVTGSYQLSKHFHLGLIYQPSLFKIKPQTQVDYEHVISIDFLWKFKVIQ